MAPADQTALKAAIASILEHAHAFTWSPQGFGMLRAYIGAPSNAGQVRLHVWDSRYRVPDVSLIHDHPWAFSSVVVAGLVRNTRFTETEEPTAAAYAYQRILCGPGGGPAGELQFTRLLDSRTAEYHEGARYGQRAADIHQSLPDDGTVTIVNRLFQEDADHARVFWPMGAKWGSAEPRPATPEEVHAITQYALGRWFA